MVVVLPHGSLGTRRTNATCTSDLSTQRGRPHEADGPLCEARDYWLFLASSSRVELFEYACTAFCLVTRIGVSGLYGTVIVPL